ncbi:MAG TPA: SCP2 sterol-binding domain-containing protein [Acidimicrobiales bacterium]|nr:SCP2 sterol-binding domain-containing protein [Acidimicrobiales bacterium]
MEFLTPEWCDELVSRTAAAAPVLRDVVVELQLTGAPRGRGRITFTVDGGRLVSCVPEPADAPDLKLKATHDDARATLRGELDPNAAFMAGDLKSDGPTGPLLALLAAYRRPGAVSAREALDAQTTDPA